MSLAAGELDAWNRAGGQPDLAHADARRAMIT
jgi:hypothetical protein